MELRSARTADIRKKLRGISPEQLRNAMQRLKDQGKVRITGERRGTAYHWQS